MTDLPEPLVPAEVDLRDFGYMPLDVLRLRDSDLAALSSGDEFKAAVMLWCVAWHQVPAASLPDDDRLLARYSGAGVAWKRLKKEALRGFMKCTDGRLYHTTIAVKALEAWEAKLKQREKANHEAERKRQEREDRSRLFGILREAGQVVPYDTKTTDLRALVTDLSHGREADGRRMSEDMSRCRREGKGREGKGEVNPVTPPSQAKPSTPPTECLRGIAPELGREFGGGES